MKEGEASRAANPRPWGVPSPPVRRPLTGKIGCYVTEGEAPEQRTRVTGGHHPPCSAANGEDWLLLDGTGGPPSRESVSVGGTNPLGLPPTGKIGCNVTDGEAPRAEDPCYYWAPSPHAFARNLVPVCPWDVYVFSEVVVSTMNLRNV